MCVFVCVCVCVREIAGKGRRIATLLSPERRASPGKMCKVVYKWNMMRGSRENAFGTFSQVTV